VWGYLKQELGFYCVRSVFIQNQILSVYAKIR